MRLRFIKAKRVYEKCIDIFGSMAKFVLKRGGVKKLEYKIANSVRLLLIAVMNLTVLYDRENKSSASIELVVFGFWFGKRTCGFTEAFSPPKTVSSKSLRSSNSKSSCSLP